MLKVNSINFKYSGTKSLLLKKVKFQVEKGEQVYLCGESGTGKSSLLKLIYGQLDATAGSIRLNNQPVYGPKYNLVPGEENIKLVNQEFKLLPNHTVFENIVFHLKFESKKEKLARSSFLADKLELIKLLKKLPATLSGGEKQRVAIAQALAQPPDLLLLDEPFAHLDYQTQEKTQDLVNSLLKEEKISSITVTHNPFDALKNADRILFFKDGGIIEQGSPNEIYHQPKTLSCAKFFGKLNQISPSEFIRPEHLFESEKGQNFTIAAKHLNGPFWEYEIKAKNHNWLWYSANEDFNIGEIVKIEFQKEKVIQIDNF